MRGEVLYYDETQRFGFIQASDGKRYAFGRENLRRDGQVGKGIIVEFQPNGGEARDIFVIAPPEGATAGLSMQPEALAGTSPHFGRQATAPVDAYPATGLWAYFRRALTSNYANFSGRARRKEYWGYFLFWIIAFAAICFMALAVDAAAGNLDTGEQAPILTIAAAGLFVLATLLPGLGLTIRRIHDIGLSGWFYLLVFIPTIGSLIVLVFCLIPSQKNDNRWGPVPEGIRA